MTNIGKTPSYLLKRGDIYYFRWSVPHDLRKILSKQEIRCSLGTRVRREARVKAQMFYQKLTCLSVLLETKGGSGMKKLSHEEIQAIVFNSCVEYLREDFESRFLSGKRFHSEGDPFDESETYSCLASDCQEKLVMMDYSSEYAWVDDILAKRGVALSQDSVEYQALARLHLTSVVAMLEITSHRYAGDFEFEKKELLKFRPESLGVTHMAKPQEPKQQTLPDGPSLSDALEKFVNEKTSTDCWTIASSKDVIPTLQQFIDIVGDKGCRALQKFHIRDYREKLLRLPANYRKFKQYKELSIEEVLALPLKGMPHLSNNTLNTKFIKVKGFLSWLENQGYSEEQGLGKALSNIRAPKQRGKAKALFNEEVRAKIFHPDNLCGKYVKEPFQFWVPLLGLYTGARLEELCQLHVEDIRQEDGVWHLDINNKGDKHVKTPVSIRKVPIHPGLLRELGFLAFVEAKKEQGEGRLFPELGTVSRTGKVSDRASKWFSRYLGRVGVKPDDSGEKVCFHSFRGTFTNYCKQKSMDDKKTKEVVGHSHGEDVTEAHYNAPYGIRILFEDVVSKVDFGIDLQGLRVSPFVFEDIPKRGKQ